MSYSGNLLVENHHELIMSSRVWEATGIAERYAALEMLQEVTGIGRVTVGGDKGFDTADFVREGRNLHMTPHVPQNLGRRGGSAIEGRTTRRRHQPEEKEAHRRMFWLAEDDCVAAQGAASRDLESRLDVHLCSRGLQPGAYAKPDGRRGSSTVSPGRSVSAWR